MNDSVFIDFNDTPAGIALVRISFDGYGCCRIGDHSIPLNLEDSNRFRKLFNSDDLDQQALGEIVRKAIALNKSLIWEDALREYKLILSAAMKLPEDWIEVKEGEGDSLFEELKREVAPGHKLYGAQLTVVAHKDGTDDILCRYNNEPDRYCLMHLTWLGKQEDNTVFPFVELDGDFDSFLTYEKNLRHNEAEL